MIAKEEDAYASSFLTASEDSSSSNASRLNIGQTFPIAYFPSITRFSKSKQQNAAQANTWAA